MRVKEREVMLIICYVEIQEEKRFADYLKKKEKEGYTVYNFKNCKENLNEIVGVIEQVSLFVGSKLFILEDDLGIEALRLNDGADIVLLLSKKSRKKGNKFETLKFEKFSKEKFGTMIGSLANDLSITLTSDMDEIVGATCYHKVDSIYFALIENYFKSRQGLSISSSNIINDFRDQGFTLEDNAFKLLNAIVYRDNALEILQDLMRTNNSHKIFGGLLYQLRQINKFLCLGGNIKGTDINGYQSREYQGYIEHLGMIKIQKLNSIALEGYGIINSAPDKVLIATIVKMITFIKN